MFSYHIGWKRGKAVFVALPNEFTLNNCLFQIRNKYDCLGAIAVFWQSWTHWFISRFCSMKQTSWNSDMSTRGCFKVKNWDKVERTGCIRLVCFQLGCMLPRIDHMLCPWKPSARGGLVSDQWRRRVKVSMTSGCVFFFCICLDCICPSEGIDYTASVSVSFARREGGEKKNQNKKNTNPTEGWWTDATNRAKTALIF